MRNLLLGMATLTGIAFAAFVVLAAHGSREPKKANKFQPAARSRRTAPSAAQRYYRPLNPALGKR